MSTTRNEVMENGIILVRDDDRFLIFYPFTGRAEVIYTIDNSTPLLISINCRTVSKEDFDMGLALFGIEQ